MTKKKIRNIVDWVIIVALAAAFLCLTFRLNSMEPWIYQTFDIHVGNPGSYSIPKLTGQFVRVAILSCICSLVFGLAIGLLCYTSIGQEFRPVIDKVSTALRAYPEIAMLRFVVPLLGLGVLPAVVALTAHGVLPIIFSTWAGIDNIDPTYIKVARSMGMSKWQIMFKVQLPMAVPVIVSGLRVALISCVGGATLATSTGAGGLGILLSAGQDTYNVVLIMECAVLICLLSLLTDKSLLKLEQKLTHADRLE